MLYIEDLTMHHYVGFSQIGSHLSGPNLIRADKHMICIYDNMILVL